MKYKVLMATEIGGQIRQAGTILDESEFAPALPVEQQRVRTEEEIAIAGPILSEAESLVKTGHIVVVE